MTRMVSKEEFRLNIETANSRRNSKELWRKKNSLNANTGNWLNLHSAGRSDRI